MSNDDFCFCFVVFLFPSQGFPEFGDDEMVSVPDAKYTKGEFEVGHTHTHTHTNTHTHTYSSTPITHTHSSTPITHTHTAQHLSHTYTQLNTHTCKRTNGI